MSIFNLPDLGEGLPDAEISEWHVKEGDTVKVDQPLVSMETAKALVEVPSPEDGIIKTLHGKAGEIIKTGSPLVSFEGKEKKKDTGTVVGSIETSDETVEETFTIGAIKKTGAQKIKATPAVRALAKQLKVDLNSLTPKNSSGVITVDDVREASETPSAPAEGYEALHGVRRSMAFTMTKANQEVVPVTIYDDADINNWAEDSDITVNLIQAIVIACSAEPAINAWYDGKSNARKLHDAVNLGMAVDTGEDLFVPVIKDVQDKSAADLRAQINKLKQAVLDRKIPQEDLHGATITLSNFGKFSGRYASPIIVPPTVAILAVGRLRDEVVADNGKAVVHRVLPLSLSFDHRAVTGGEATRFLGEMIKALEASD